MCILRSTIIRTTTLGHRRQNLGRMAKIRRQLRLLAILGMHRRSRTASATMRCPSITSCTVAISDLACLIKPRIYKIIVVLCTFVFYLCFNLYTVDFILIKIICNIAGIFMSRNKRLSNWK